MKTTFLLLLAALAALQLSSCCSVFGGRAANAGSYEETYYVKTGDYEVVRQEKLVDAKSGLVEVTETKVPRVKQKTRTVYVKCPKCTRFYCANAGCCGSGGKYLDTMVTAQPATGSPFIGLVPTMKPLASEE